MVGSLSAVEVVMAEAGLGLRIMKPKIASAGREPILIPTMRVVERRRDQFLKRLLFYAEKRSGSMVCVLKGMEFPEVGCKNLR